MEILLVTFFCNKIVIRMNAHVGSDIHSLSRNLHSIQSGDILVIEIFDDLFFENQQFCDRREHNCWFSKNNGNKIIGAQWFWKNNSSKMTWFYFFCFFQNCTFKARAAAFAKAPPDPTAIMPSFGSNLFFKNLKFYKIGQISILQNPSNFYVYFVQSHPNCIHFVDFLEISSKIWPISKISKFEKRTHRRCR